jgi:hypothetical protein
VSEQAAQQVAVVNPSAANAGNAVLTSMPQPIDTSLPRRARTATLSLPSDQSLAVGEKRRIAIQLNSQAPLGLAVVSLRFDPRVLKVNGITAGDIFKADKAPSITQSVDPSGVCLVSVSTLNGVGPMTGAGTLLFIEIEGVAIGDALLLLDKDNMHLVATDARDVALEVNQGRTTVKQ